MRQHLLKNMCRTVVNRVDADWDEKMRNVPSLSSKELNTVTTTTWNAVYSVVGGVVRSSVSQFVVRDLRKIIKQ